MYVCDGAKVERSKPCIVLGFASEYTKDRRFFLRNREPIVLIRAHMISSEQGSRPTASSRPSSLYPTPETSPTSSKPAPDRLWNRKFLAVSLAQ